MLLAGERRPRSSAGSDDAKRSAERRGNPRQASPLFPTASAQVLDGLVAGQANKMIAFDLGISPRTVEIYRANLMTKMEANSLSDLVRMALIVGMREIGIGQRLTPRPCMKRSRICTGSRSVVPTPGLSSMRAAIRLGPPSVSAAPTSRSKSSSSAAQALLAMPAAARDRDQIGGRRARGRLRRR